MYSTVALSGINTCTTIVTFWVTDGYKISRNKSKQAVVEINNIIIMQVGVLAPLALLLVLEAHFCHCALQ